MAYDENDGSGQATVGCDARIAGRSVEIVASLQGINALTSIIQRLGLSIDISGATLDGSGDDSEHDCDLPVSIADLMLGQFIKVELDSSQLPVISMASRWMSFAWM